MRTGLLPLWAEHVGLSAGTTSLIFALAAAVDIVLFYPGGWVMDRYGRAVVAVPVVLSVAVACLLLPLTTGAAGVAAVMVLIAAGNGLGSGIVMTIGADTAPVRGRSQYLGGWRLCGDIGVSGGPLLVGARRRGRAAGDGLGGGRACWRSGAPCGWATGPRGWTARRGASADRDLDLVGGALPVSVSTTRNRCAPGWPVWTYVANVWSLTETVTGKSDQLPPSKRCTCRIAPSPGRRRR